MSEWEQRLLSAAEKLRQVETAYHSAVTALREAKEQCAMKEAEFVASGKVNMKNSDTRNADLWRLAKAERKDVVAKESKLDSLRAELHYRQSVFEALLLCAKFALQEPQAKKEVDT